MVVDEGVVPIFNATIEVQGASRNTTTEENGVFTFEDLAPGFYQVVAKHPLFGTVQAVSEVVAGENYPDILKIQMTRLFSSDPYTSQTLLAGYVFCSSSTATLISEECGEGLGVPTMGRIGGHPENHAQVDFWTDGDLLRTIVAELVWEPTLTVGGGVQEGQVHAGLFTEHDCAPICDYEALIDDKRGPSPLVLRNDDGEQGGDNYFFGDASLESLEITPETRFSVFVWASDEQNGILFEQPFELIVTLAYVLPLPDEWSILAGDTLPN